MRFPLLYISLTALLAAPVAAQCSDMTVSGDGSAGSTLSFALTGGAAEAPAIVFVGPNEGNFSINLGPLGSLDLGLAPPFIPLFMGLTDGSGDATLEFDLPPATLPQIDLFAQGTTIEFTPPDRGPPSIDFCTSDVEAFSIGGS